jgi:hypothetical protein
VVHTASSWSLESAGWSVDESEESIAFLPCDAEDEAALIVSAFRKANAAITPEELWEMSGKASPASAARAEVRCGDFHGYHATYDEDGTHWRVWWLAHRATHLYVTFNCAPDDAGKHDAVLDWMLSTLRAVPYTV